MKINSISSCSFTGENKQKNNLKPFVSPLMSGTCALIGYSIPLKEIEGADVVSQVTSGRKLVMMKTKIPNIVSKWEMLWRIHSSVWV